MLPSYTGVSLVESAWGFTKIPDGAAINSCHEIIFFVLFFFYDAVTLF